MVAEINIDKGNFANLDLSFLNPDDTVVNKRVQNATELITPDDPLIASNSLGLLYTMETWGVDLTGIQISAGGEIIGGNLENYQNLTEIFEVLRHKDINPVISIYDQANLPEELSYLRGRSKNSKFVLLNDSKRQWGRNSSTPLGLVQFDYEEEDVAIPSGVGYEVFENQDESFRDNDKFFTIYKALRTLAYADVDSIFKKILDNTISTTEIDSEKLSILNDLSILITKRSKGFSDDDIQFLSEFEESIINGAYNGVFKNAIKDTITAAGITQLTALTSPLLGTIVGTKIDPGLGVVVASGTYIGAPIPAWIYTQLRNRMYRGSFDGIAKMGGSLAAMNAPIVGAGIAFPLSIDAQTDGAFGRFNALKRRHPEFVETIDNKKKVLDFLLYGIMPNSINLESEEVTSETSITTFEDAEDETVELASDWDVVETIPFHDGTHFEIVKPMTEEAITKLKRFTAKEHIAHNLSDPSDSNIFRVHDENGDDLLDENGQAIYEMIETTECPIAWIVVRDPLNDEILVASKMYRREGTPMLPFQEKLYLERNDDLGKVIYTSHSAKNTEVLEINHEIGGLAFNSNALSTQNSLDRAHKTPIALLAWLRGLKMYMDENKVKEFGAVFTTKASSYLGLVGELGIEFLSEPFFYYESDKQHQITSQVMRLNMDNSYDEMLKKNPDVHKFVMKGIVDDVESRKRIIGNVAENMRNEAMRRKKIKKYIQTTLLQMFVNLPVNRILY